MNENEEVLSSQIDSNGTLSELSGGVVILGLVLEVIFAFIQRGKSQSWMENWTPVIADSLVAAGVVGEIWFAGRASIAEKKLRRISNEKVAEANERTATAELELGKIKSRLDPRLLTADQSQALQELKGQIPKIIVVPASAGIETLNFAFQIHTALKAAEIMCFMGDLRIGMNYAGVGLVFPSSITDYAAEPLAVMASKIGLTSSCFSRNVVPMGDLPLDIPVILVGEKPLQP